jgi:hypothetical protein
MFRSFTGAVIMPRKMAQTSLFIVLSITFISPGEAKDCVTQWNQAIDKYNEAKELDERGWNIVVENPERSFTHFNRAHSIAKEGVRLDVGCNKVVDGDKLSKAKRELVVSARCGMAFKTVISTLHKFNENKEESTLHRLLRELKSSDIHHFCADNRSVMKYVRETKELLEKNLK